MRKEELINLYLEKILLVNQQINLTRITATDEAQLLHVEDSLIALEEINKAPKGLYVDLGSGGGFPGVPIGIMTERDTILVDSVQKKMTAVSSVLEETGLEPAISTFGGRIEDFTQSHKNEVAVVTARALSKLSILMELASPLLKQEGVLVCYKANVEQDEWDHACLLQRKLGMYVHSDRQVYLSDGVTQRRIICFQKRGKAQISLPRHNGFAQKKPL